MKESRDEATSTQKGHDFGPIVGELINVLAPHPEGLRRWSVMRAIRAERERASRYVSPKFEIEIERVFREFCADSKGQKTRRHVEGDMLFHRPNERAGEVWALNPDKAKAWLAGAPPQWET